MWTDPSVQKRDPDLRPVRWKESARNKPNLSAISQTTPLIFQLLTDLVASDKKKIPLTGNEVSNAIAFVEMSRATPCVFTSAVIFNKVLID